MMARCQDVSRIVGPDPYWKATSAKLRSLRLCSWAGPAARRISQGTVFEVMPTLRLMQWLQPVGFAN